MNFQFYGRTNTLKILVNVQIGESQHTQSPNRFQILRAFQIIFYPFFFVMLTAIQFNDQFGFWTEKVHDISANYFLPFKLKRICPQELIPQCIFFFGRVFS